MEELDNEGTQGACSPCKRNRRGKKEDKLVIPAYRRQTPQKTMLSLAIVFTLVKLCRSLEHAENRRINCFTMRFYKTFVSKYVVLRDDIKRRQLTQKENF